MKRRDFIRPAGIGALAATLPRSGRTGRGQGEGFGEQGPSNDPRFQEIAALIEAKMAEYGVPGVAFGLVKDGTVSMRGFGLTNVDNPQPVTIDTVFPIASITKTVVTAAMLGLASRRD